MDNHLNNQWTLWYHDPYNNEWNIDSYKNIYTITTINDFAKIKNSWSILPTIKSSMYFLMRIHIKPMWEDKNNISGGLWSFKITGTDNDILDTWMKLSIYLQGESLLKNTNNYKLINGISISPKKFFSIIKIWCKEEFNNTLFNDDLLTILDFKNGIYKPHNENILKDNKKKFKNKMIKFKKNRK